VSKGSHLWVTNPSEDEPAEMGNHTHGIRSFEEEILGRDSLLFVLQLPSDVTFPYALCYVPGGHRAFINEGSTAGRIYLHYGTTLIAVTASQPFDWDPKAGIHAQASKAREGDSEFRVRSLACAVAIETALPSEFPAATPGEQLAKFKERLQARSSLKMTGKNPAAALYQNRLGDRIECVFNGPDKVNGTEVDYQAWPTSESPWTRQKTNEGPLEITDGKTVRTYDFTNWKISEQSH
jgi:hypothetical protein